MEFNRMTQSSNWLPHPAPTKVDFDCNVHHILQPILPPHLHWPPSQTQTNLFAQLWNSFRHRSISVSCHSDHGHIGSSGDDRTHGTVCGFYRHGVGLVVRGNSQTRIHARFAQRYRHGNQLTNYWCCCNKQMIKNKKKLSMGLWAGSFLFLHSGPLPFQTMALHLFSRTVTISDYGFTLVLQDRYHFRLWLYTCSPGPLPFQTMALHLFSRTVTISDYGFTLIPLCFIHT